jgi:dTDP-4-amino-4,6-dideoxygalactose transaminase
MIPFAKPDISDQEVAAVTEALRSGWLTTGKVAKDFEAEFGSYFSLSGSPRKRAAAVSSATMGAMLLFEALGVGPGDEVVFPTWTFSGPAMMAHKLGAKVVLADVGEDFMLTSQTLRPKMNGRTKLVVPTHYAGRALDMDALQWVVGLNMVVDDAAHAFPAVDGHDQMVGEQGTMATFFSFYATKTVTTGDGGMVVSDDDELLLKIERLRCHGISRDVFDRYVDAKQSWAYDVAEPGWKANLPDVLAAIGLEQVRRATDMARKRKWVATRYNEGLYGLEVIGRVILPEFDDGAAHHLFPLRITHPEISRDQFIDEMRQRGVMCSMHFIPLHKHSFWRKTLATNDADFPMANQLALQEVSLPIYSIMTSDEVDTVIEAALEILSG